MEIARKIILMRVPGLLPLILNKALFLKGFCCCVHFEKCNLKNTFLGLFVTSVIIKTVKEIRTMI